MMNRTEQQEHGKLIDADKLLQELFNVDEEEWTTPEIRAILENASPVEPKRPKGEWIMHIDDLFPCESTQECSVCHAEQPISISDDNFCPNCGADMRKE